MVVSKLSAKKVTVERKLINNLLSDWGLFIQHGYYVSNENDNDVLSERNGKIVINAYFDQILELMSQKCEERELYITTIRHLLDYWLLLEKISTARLAPRSTL